MYIITRIPQVDGTVRFVGVQSRRQQRAAQRLLRDDPAMIDAIRADAVRDMPPGRKPRGWQD